MIGPFEDKRPLWHYIIKSCITYISLDHSRFFSVCLNLAWLYDAARRLASLASSLDRLVGNKLLIVSLGYL